MRKHPGIERRTDTKGETAFRPYVKLEGRKVRGPWTTSLAEARAWRTKTLARRDEGLIEPDAPTNAPTLRDAAYRFLTEAEEGRAWTRSGDPFKPSALRNYRVVLDLHVLPQLAEGEELWGIASVTATAHVLVMAA